MLFTLFTLFTFQGAFSQDPRNWNLESLRYAYFQFSSSTNFLATKVKYTSQNHPSVIFNEMTYNPNCNLSINQLDPNDYMRTTNTNNMAIMKGLYSQLLFVNGSTSNYAKDFETDANDNYVVLGDNKGSGWNLANPILSSLLDSTQLLLFKININGVLQWQKIYGGSSSEFAVAIRKARDGNFIVLAQTQSNDGDVTGYNGGKDIWLFKINSTDGNLIWKKTIGTTTDEIPTDLEILGDGSIIISGFAQSSSLFPSGYSGFNSFLLKLDEAANIQWSKVFGGNGNDKINSFATMPDGGFISISTTSSSDGDYPVNSGGSDVYILRHDVTGNIVWAKHYGFTDNDIAGDIAVSVCDTTIFASWSKEFTGPVQPFASYPRYSQNSGIRVALLSNGVETSYYQEAFSYSYLNGNYAFNDFITSSIAANDRGGVFCAENHHIRWNDATNLPPYLVGNVTRTFSISEFGIPLVIKNYDTSICKGQLAWGNIYFTDTTYADTLRNNCNIDTAIKKYKVHVIDGDTITKKHTTLCSGAIYKGVPVYVSFIEKDTIVTNTICGPKLNITNNYINIAPAIVHRFGKDSTLCKNQTMQLNPYSPAASYLWQDGSTSKTYTVSLPGTYWVEVIDTFGCKKRDTIKISLNDLFLTVPPDVNIILSQTASLSPQTNGLILWDYLPTLSCTACQTTIANPTTTQVYTLSSRKNGCLLNASIKVIVNKNYYLYIPSAFTPDDNGNNDFYKVYTNLTGYFKMSLYNRYGEKLFETTDPNNGWDGNFKGAKQPFGTYTYVVTYHSNFTVPQQEKGSFILIR